MPVVEFVPYKMSAMEYLPETCSSHYRPQYRLTGGDFLLDVRALQYLVAHPDFERRSSALG